MTDVRTMTREEALGKAAHAGELERFVIHWQLGALSGFKSALARLIAAADEPNREKIRRGFPTEVYAMEAWLKGGMAAKLRAEGYPL